jgi:quinoprotein glucose dehydrogenase
MRIFETFLLLGIAASGLYSQTDWPGYGGDPGGQRYSGLSQINTKNVSKLKLAWQYGVDPSAIDLNSANRLLTATEAVPIMVGGVLFTPTVRHTIVALEPETGKEIWKYELGRAVAAPMRGLTYWPGDKENPAEILAGTSDGKLIALNANWRRGQDFGGVKMGRTGAHCNSTGSPG